MVRKIIKDKDLMSNYFKNFPVIDYDGAFLRNILHRVKFNEKVKNFYTAFYPYTIKDGERLDMISEEYYGQSSSMWMIQLINDVVDPYYDVPLSEANFKSFLIKKYGTIRNAHRTVLYYKNNWNDDFDLLSVSGYNALSELRKSYWDPVMGEYNRVINYVRKREDWISSTNQSTSADFVTELDDEAFIKGERVYVQGDENSYAFVTWANTSVINFQHIADSFGDSLSSSNTVIIGETSEVEVNIDSTTYKILQEVIPVELKAYYSPVTAFEVEEAKNTSKKEILVLDSQYEGRVNDALFKALR